MRELKEHQAYQLLTSKYEMVCLDYVILQCDEEYVGKEWWGTGLWSVYDSKENVFIIIGASLTD